MLKIRGMSTVGNLLGVMVHPAALALHGKTCPTVFLLSGFQVGGWVNARPDPAVMTPLVPVLRGQDPLYCTRSRLAAGVA